MRGNVFMSKEKDLNGLKLHSDLMLQYLSNENQKIFQSHGLNISQSRKADLLNNAVIESFHLLLTKETLLDNVITFLKTYIQNVYV
jgi:transposase InsO family protein